MATSDSVLTRNIRGEIPCKKLYEDATVFAFLDINPLSDGHALVVPRRQVERLEQLSPAELADLARAIHTLAPRILRAVGAADYNVLQNNGSAAGQVVPHVHFHIIPRRAGDGLGYRWNPQSRTPAELASLAARINQPT